jgi:putative component of membrane protein insertase Oxa1/YidC/SpoIIIJ protein YidD
MYWIPFTPLRSLGRILLLSLLFSNCLNDSAGICREAGSSASDRDRLQASVRENREGLNIGACLASIFREHISAVDGDRRPSLPSSFSYSGLAIKRHGFFMGWVMTVHRLTHQGDKGSGSSGRGGVFLKGRNIPHHSMRRQKPPKI